ncbi:MAG: hypothetical protein BroJett026_19430 [Betaproteobacteria bacterium]|nr:MAG: hypothetical protein BroJett026_19430 [Betaproteobacteria bacterium]
MPATSSRRAFFFDDAFRGRDVGDRRLRRPAGQARAAGLAATPPRERTTSPAGALANGADFVHDATNDATPVLAAVPSVNAVIRAAVPLVLLLAASGAALAQERFPLDVPLLEHRTTGCHTRENAELVARALAERADRVDVPARSCGVLSGWITYRKLLLRLDGPDGLVTVYQVELRGHDRPLFVVQVGYLHQSLEA